MNPPVPVVVPMHGSDRPPHVARPGIATALFLSRASHSLREKLDQLARSDATILLIGETGTGKEVAARYLHAQSRRQARPFVAVNCGALSDSLAEADLFGYEKGAYTGAARTQAGWFEAAHGGTLLLDEIGELPLSLQVKLLRVLQEREVTRVGSRTAIPIDVRVIAATNIDLAKATLAGRFREDLLFRLNVAPVLLPPLRERGAQEIEALARHFLHSYASAIGAPETELGAEALGALLRHRWPGNIRELENVIHGATLLAGGGRIEREHLQLRMPSIEAAAGPAELIDVLRPLFDERIRRHEPDLFNRVTGCLIQAGFDAAQGNQVKAARSLGITRHELRTRLSHLGVIPRRRAKAALNPAASRHGPDELHIGYQSYGTLSLMKAERALERRLQPHGVRVFWKHFPAGPQLLDALHSGTIDFGATGEVPPIFAQANGAPLVYVAHDPPAPRGVALIVPRDSPIHRVTDLRGAQIALNKGSNVHYLLVQCLEAHGLSLDDVQPVYLPPEDATRAFDSGEVDAAVAWDPFLTVAQRSGNVRILVDGTGLVSNYQFHVARTEFAARFPDTIQSLLRELRKTSRSAVSNPVKAAQCLSGELGIDAASLEIVVRRFAHGAKPLEIGVIREQQKIADRFYALGLIPRAIAIRDAVWAPTP